jgi:hypothetical protein
LGHIDAEPTLDLANRSGSGGRTYSGVCAAGQATADPVLMGSGAPAAKPVTKKQHGSQWFLKQGGIGMAGAFRRPAKAGLPQNAPRKSFARIAVGEERAGAPATWP